jgi:hypothetical protein
MSTMGLALGFKINGQETVDRRVLAAFVCTDALTGASITRPMLVTAASWKVRPNRSGVYVVFDGPGFDAQTGEFMPAGAWPGAVSLPVTLQDPQQQYQPRVADVNAPVSVPAIPPAPAGIVPNPAVVAAQSDATTIFCPQKVTLYPTAAAATGPNWAVLRVSVTDTTSGKGLSFAMLKAIRQSDSTVLTTGQTDANGEALLAIVGLTTSTNTSGSGPVSVSTVALNVDVIFDPSVLTQPAAWIANPDTILNSTSATLITGSQAVEIGPGQELNLSFQITA